VPFKLPAVSRETAKTAKTAKEAFKRLEKGVGPRVGPDFCCPPLTSFHHWNEAFFGLPIAGKSMTEREQGAARLEIGDIGVA
jgi:hypothetical protein